MYSGVPCVNRDVSTWKRVITPESWHVVCLIFGRGWKKLGKSTGFQTLLMFFHLRFFQTLWLLFTLSNFGWPSFYFTLGLWNISWVYCLIKFIAFFLCVCLCNSGNLFGNKHLFLSTCLHHVRNLHHLSNKIYQCKVWSLDFFVKWNQNNWVGEKKVKKQKCLF